MEIAGLSGAEFKPLLMRMLRDLIGYGKSIRDEMKATLRAIQKNLQGTNGEGKEARVQIMNWNTRKKEMVNQNRMKK